MTASLPANHHLLPGRTDIAYFSMEIALRPEIHTYSGGLGVLAGDTMRSCADLELPVVFVTLISRAGYLRQSIDADGNQIDAPDPWQPEDWAAPLGAKIALDIQQREVWIRPWLFLHAGGTEYRVPVILLDTDLEENSPEDRLITDRLYGGDEVHRLKQEIVLGIGGQRMLQALGFDIRTYHMNEGHSALLALALLVRHHRDAAAVQPAECAYEVSVVREMCVFTTHTPVETGHDRFPYPIVQDVLGDFIDLQQLQLVAGSDALNMTLLALNLSGYVNGVAKRHAETSQRMFPGYRVRAVGNGVHPGTWICPSFARLYHDYLPDWQHDPDILVQADSLPDDAVWAAHQEAKAALIDLAKERAGTALDAAKPILAFARRMTGYKRLDLIFEDLERLVAIARGHPFQIVVAGKAHPLDDTGHATIRHVHECARRLGETVPVVFLADYDMRMAQIMVAGADVWLNTPLPPLEASGTSGMKAALNGVLNLSVLDGWWLEACIDGVTGWACGDTDPAKDAGLLLDKLDGVVLPLYHENRRRWIWMMKQAIAKIAYRYNSHHMMRRYAAEAYLR